MNPFEPIDPKCETCRYWANFDGTPSGDCRRYAPRPNATAIKPGTKNHDFRRVNWVWTMKDEWCGEYSQAVEK